MKEYQEAREKKEFPYMVASVNRAMELLLILENSPQDMGVTELSKVLGVQKSTIHNLLQTLQTQDFVRQTDSGRYTLGFRLMRLGQSASERLDIRRLALPLLRELAEESNEYVLFAIVDRNELTIVANVPPPRPTFLVPRFDYCHTFHSSALGKVFLAFCPEEQQEQILQQDFARYTPYTLVDRKSLTVEIAKIRAKGYAVACNETIEGVTCIGVPVFNVHGKLEAAVSVSSASAWLTNAKYDAMANILLTKARALSKLLGY